MVVNKVHRVSALDRATQDQSGQQFVQFWRVEYDGSTVNLPFGTPFDSVTATDGTTSIPAYGAQLSATGAGSLMYVINKTAQVTANAPHINDVYVTYGPAESVTLRIQPVPYQDAVITDINGKAVRNSALQAYPKTFNPERFDELVIATVTSLSSPPNFDSLVNCTNDADITFAAQGLTKTCATGTARLLPPSPTATYSVGGWAQYTTEYTWKVRADGWRDVVPDSGTAIILRNASGMAIHDASGNALVISLLDAFNRPYNNGRPFFLDGHGNKLADSATSCILGPNSDGTWGTAGAADAAGVQLYDEASMNAMLDALGIGS